MNVLVAIDGSDASEAAALAVRERTWPESTVFRVFSVAEHVRPAGPLPYNYPQDMHLPEASSGVQTLAALLLERARAQASHVAEAFESAGLRAEAVAELGDPRDSIIDQALRWPADLIVVGTHGRTGLKRWIMGSVAESVVRHAPCSVEVSRVRSRAV